jgi:Leucine-rich repeat (LRR) protein
MGRMTRLCVLNIADNKLTDLPLSLGYCNGLSKFGAGINMERNPIQDTEMIRKYRIGPGTTLHLHIN